MNDQINDRTATDAPAASDDMLLAAEFAEERYTAARRKYTSLYVELQSQENPKEGLTQEVDAARGETLALATALRKVEEGDLEAIRAELEAGRVSDNERSRTTNRFTIAELRRAAAAQPASWNWKP